MRSQALKRRRLAQSFFRKGHWKIGFAANMILAQGSESLLQTIRVCEKAAISCCHCCSGQSRSVEAYNKRPASAHTRRELRDEAENSGDEYEGGGLARRTNACRMPGLYATQSVYGPAASEVDV
jgi:hypothetical protein